MFHYAIAKKMKQITNTILMIEPVAFRYNEETALNNYYQKDFRWIDSRSNSEESFSEFNDFVDILREKGLM